MSTIQRVILGIFSHVVKVCGGHEATVLAGLTLLPVTAQCDRGQRVKVSTCQQVCVCFDPLCVRVQPALTRLVSPGSNLNMFNFVDSSLFS